MKPVAACAVAIPAALVLWGCPPKPPVSYLPRSPDAATAFGQAPAWTLTMDRRGFTFASEEMGIARSGRWEGSEQIAYRTYRYTTADIVVDFLPGHCIDPVDGQRYFNAYRVSVDGQELEGCGGAELPPADLSGSSWRGDKWIGTHGDRRDFSGSLTFADGRLTGSTGCNRIAASYTVAGSILTVGPVTVTKMACDGNIAKNEAAMLGILSGEPVIGFDGEGNLSLFQATTGRSLTFRTVE